MHTPLVVNVVDSSRPDAYNKNVGNNPVGSRSVAEGDAMSKRSKLVREVGPPAIGDRFFNRDHEVQMMTEQIKDGAHLLMVAMRRVGKTSLMKEVAHQLGEDFHCLYIDLQRCPNPADAIVQLAIATKAQRSLWSKITTIFSNLLGSVEELSMDEITIKLRDGLSGGWVDKADRIVADLASADRPVVLFIDELPILINRILKRDDYEVTQDRIASADLLMSWLRDVSIRHQGTIRIVIAGSIGLEPILRQAGLSATLNTLTPFELEPWDAETATSCLHALAEQYGLHYEEGATERIVTKLGCCIPHHVQMFFSHILDDRRRKGDMSCSVQVVEQVYEGKMLSSRGHAELSHFEERLKWVLGPARLPLALDLLTEAAVVAELSPEAALTLALEHYDQRSVALERLREALLVLEHDGYLLARAGKHTFLSSLLRDWWRSRFSLGYVPTSKS